MQTFAVMRDPNEHFASVGDVELCYETFGDVSDPACLLIMGLGTQMIAWREEFCEGLADARLPRDPLRQPRLRALDAPRRRADADAPGADQPRQAAGLQAPGHGARRRRAARRPRHPARTRRRRFDGRDDRPDARDRRAGARDLAGLDHGQHRRADLGQPSLRIFRELLRPPATDRDGYIEQVVDAFELVGSPGFERDQPALRELLELGLRPGRRPADGFARQLGAIVSSGSRRRRLGRITAPTFVIHGSADRLVGPSGGRATARAIPERTC